MSNENQQNSGVIEDPRTEEEKLKDWIAGGETGVKDIDRLDTPDWDQYIIPKLFEPQSVPGVFDTLACTHFAPGKELELQLIWDWKNGKLSEKCMEFLQQYLMTPGDIESLRLSKTYAAITGGNTKNGNWFTVAYEGYRKFGAIPYTMLPDITNFKNWDEYHNKSLVTGDMLEIGRQFKEFFDIKYDLLYKDDVPGISVIEEVDWEKYLKQAPLNINIPGHSLTLYNIKDLTYGRFDHYIPFKWDDDRTKKVLLAFRVLITEKTPELPPEKPIHTFLLNMEKGMRSEEVKWLQKCYIYEGLMKKGLDTGYFGPITKQATIKFQEKYADKILKPLGLTKGTGRCLEMTRKMLNELYGA